MGSSAKVFWNGLAIVAFTLLILGGTGWFALSDWVELCLHGNDEILETKPWRPFARLCFGAVSVPMILFFAYWSAACLSRRVRHGLV